jgi:hypothetical protein
VSNLVTTTPTREGGGSNGEDVAAVVIIAPAIYAAGGPGGRPHMHQSASGSGGSGSIPADASMSLLRAGWAASRRDPPALALTTSEAQPRTGTLVGLHWFVVLRVHRARQRPARWARPADEAAHRG